MKKQLIAFAVLAASALSTLAANPMVELKTNQGEIVVELFADKAPKSAENFVQYVKSGHYDGTIFHRVIGTFMIQGGGFTPDSAQKPTRPPIPLEAGNGLSNVRGTLAMARTSEPNSATSQFFINVVDNQRLDSFGGGYAVFGKVVAGMDVVDQIKAVPTANQGGPFANRPTTDVIIKKATLEN